jgi:hypothetical protein
VKRPLAVTIIGWLFIVSGAVGIIYHFNELNIGDPLFNDAILILFVRLLAIIGGVLVLRKAGIGRWLLVAWMGYHVVLSYFHPMSELIMHAILWIGISIALFHPRVTEFFKS